MDQQQIDELDDLLGTLRDGEIDEQRMARLERMLNDDAEALRYYVDFTRLCSDLRYYHGHPSWGRAGNSPFGPELTAEGELGTRNWEPESETIPSSPFPVPRPELRVPSSKSRWRLVAGSFAMAAAVALVASLVTLWVAPGRRVQGPGFADEGGVAVLTRTADAEWKSDAAALSPGSALRPGKLRLSSGLAQVEFYSGATVVLEGPAEFEIVSADRGFFHHGKVRAHVPPQAHGFTIGAPGVDVVDLGTEFGLSVDASGKAEVHVFDGEVRLEGTGTGSARGAAPASKQSLTTGQGLRLGSAGERETIEADDRAFAGPARLAGLSDETQRRRRDAWVTHSEQLRRDPGVVLYYTFENQEPWDRTVRDHAERVAGVVFDPEALFEPEPQSRRQTRRDALGNPGPSAHQGTQGRGPATAGLRLADSTPATQTSPTQRVGAVVGAQWAQGRWPGKGALEFKRTSDRVRIGVPGQFEAMTFAAWVRFDGFDRQWNSLMLTDGWEVGEPHWQVSWDGEMILGVKLGDGAGVNFFSPKGVLRQADLGRWVHLATVFDSRSGQARHYLDGRPIDTTPVPLPVGSGFTPASLHTPLTIGPAEIGNWAAWNDPRETDPRSIRNLNGRIDEFILFGRALSDTELQALYNAGKPNP